VAAARLGAQATLWAVHGDDLSGSYALAELHKEGVETDGVRSVAGGVTFVSAILVDPHGERHIFPYRGAGLTDTTEGLDLSSVGSFGALLVDGRHPVISEAALQQAKRRGIPTVGDFSDTRSWHLTRLLDYLLVSEECAEEVLGRNDPEAALAALRRHPKQLVGITLGEEGFLYDDMGTVRHVTSLPVEVIDTNGAGDVFHGAYTYGVARGWSAERCGLFASVTAALSCTGLGRSAIPSAVTVNQLLEERTAKEMEEMRWT
jgi:sulfofructose kinase